MTDIQSRFLKRWFEVDERDFVNFDITVLPLEGLPSVLVDAAVSKGAIPERIDKRDYLVRKLSTGLYVKVTSLERETYKKVRDNPGVPIRRQYNIKDGKVLAVTELQSWEGTR